MGLRSWVTRDLWRIRARELATLNAFGLKAVRVVVIAAREFWNDRVTLRASAMTFYTLLSLVPLLMLVVSLASRFGLDDDFIRAVYDAFPEQQLILDELFAITARLVARTQTLWLTISGFFVALWSVVKVLMHMDRSFSDIWGVIRSRALWRRAVDYLIMMIALPSILMLSSSINIVLNQELEWVRQQNTPIQYTSTLINTLLILSPYLLVVTLFTFLYLFVPNTRVRFLAGLVGGVVAGAIYQIVQWGYIRFQTSVTHFDVVYGSLAAIPLLLVWLELSWLILLVGAEISYAFQNTEQYEYAQESKQISQRLYRTLSLYLLTQAVEKETGTTLFLSKRTGLPLALCERVIDEWIKTGIAMRPRKGGYQLTPQVKRWKLKTAVDALETRGSADLPLPDSKQFRHLSHFLREMSEAVEHSPANLPLAEFSK